MSGELTAAFRGGYQGLAGWYVQFGYDAAKVEALKQAIPHDCRSWDAVAKRWWVSIEYEGVLLRLWPAFRAYLDQGVLF